MILDGKILKQDILNELKFEVSKLSKAPTLCVIQVGNDEASNVYIKQKENMCNFVGYNFLHQKFEENISERDLLDKIDILNNDKNIDAILVQMPLPKHINPKAIQNKVDFLKDVDGLNDKNIIALINNKDALKPCTACGVLELLDKYKISVEGVDVVIVGRSSLVGMPLFHMLENKNATVTLCHSKTKDLKEKTKTADILISAVGKKHLITNDMVKDNAVVIDVGITKENGKLYGDVDFESIRKKASFITPVPGGVGPMTIASLAKNILNSYKMQKGIK